MTSIDYSIWYIYRYNYKCHSSWTSLSNWNDVLTTMHTWATHMNSRIVKRTANFPSSYLELKKPLGWNMRRLQETETSPVAFDTAPGFTMTWMTWCFLNNWDYYWFNSVKINIHMFPDLFGYTLHTSLWVLKTVCDSLLTNWEQFPLNHSWELWDVCFELLSCQKSWPLTGALLLKASVCY